MDLCVIIVLLQNTSVFEIESQTDQSFILLQDFRVESRVHCSINCGKSFRSRSGQTAPDHHTTATMFDCWYDVLFMDYSVIFMPDVTGQTPSKKLNFWLVSPQKVFPKVYGITKRFFWRMCKEPLCSFWSAVVFTLEFSHGCPVWLVSFLLLIVTF